MAVSGWAFSTGEAGSFCGVRGGLGIENKNVNKTISVFLKFNGV